MRGYRLFSDILVSLIAGLTIFVTATAQESATSDVDSYVVQLKSGAARQYFSDPIDNGRFSQHVNGNVANLVLDIEGRYGIHADSVSSSEDSASLTAQLTSKQRLLLEQDSRVATITQAAALVGSGSDPKAVWNTTTLPGGEVQSWGKVAVSPNLKTNVSGGTVVYVVDAGVGVHSDLNVVEWVNPFKFSDGKAKECGTRVAVDPDTGAAIPACNLDLLKYMVSCFTHSTAVAGIIGAKANGTGVQGVYPNASIVSVSIVNWLNGNTVFDQTFDKDHSSTGQIERIMCWGPPAPQPHASDLYDALEWVRKDIVRNNHTTHPSVVNISLSVPNDPTYTPMIFQKMAEIANSTPGAFIVQSANNQFMDACSSGTVYPTPSNTDGIMVVGAINNHGQPVVPLNSLMGFFEDYGAFGHDIGSNFGPCVEIWAPGQGILTTLADNWDIPSTAKRYYQSVYLDLARNLASTTGYSSIGLGSGTSFAAPHVSGMAAYLIDTNGLTSAAQVETRMRLIFGTPGGVLYDLGSHPAIGVSSSGAFTVDTSVDIKIPTTTAVAIGPKNTPYAAYAISQTCYAPAWIVASSIPSSPACKQLPLSGFAEKSGSSGELITRNFSTLTLSTPMTVYLSMDSYPPNSSCDVTLSSPQLLPGIPPVTVFTGSHYFNGGVNYNGGAITWNFYSNSCPSASINLVY